MQNSEVLKTIKSDFENGEYEAAFRGLAGATYDRYSGWTERTSPFTKIELEQAGLSPVPDSDVPQEYKHSMDIPFVNCPADFDATGYNDIGACRAAMESYKDLVEKVIVRYLEDVLPALAELPEQERLARASYILSSIQEIDNQGVVAPEEIGTLLDTYGYDGRSSYDRDRKVRKDLSHNMRCDLLGKVLHHIQTGDLRGACRAVKLGYEEINEATFMSMQGPYFFEDEIIDAYASQHGLESENIKEELLDAAMFRDLYPVITHVVTDFSDRPGSTDLPDVSPEKWEEILNCVFKKYGIEKATDIPERVTKALSGSGRPDRAQIEVFKTHLLADYSRALGAYDPWDGLPFSAPDYYHANGPLPGDGQSDDRDPREASGVLKNVNLFEAYAHVRGKPSIFHQTEGEKSEFRLQGERQATRALMLRYRELLERMDDPAYPASKVRADYYDAALNGANRTMPTWKERLAVLRDRARAAPDIFMHRDAA